MASDDDVKLLPKPSPTKPKTTTSIAYKIQTPFLRLLSKPPPLPSAVRRRRRRKMPIIKLGRGGGGRRSAFMVRAWRRLRLRWFLRRLRTFYSAAVREIVESAKAMEAVQTRIGMEAYGGVPMLPVTAAGWA